MVTFSTETHTPSTRPSSHHAGDGGFSAMDGGEELSPEEVVRNVKRLKPDVLAIPLVTVSALNDLLRTRSLLANSGVRPSLSRMGGA